MKKEEAIKRFNGIINAMSISVAQAKFYPSKAELDELCGIAIEALSAEVVNEDTQIKTELAHIEARLENVEKRLQGLILYGGVVR